MFKRVLVSTVLCLLAFSSYASLDLKKEYQDLKKTTEQKLEVFDKKINKLEKRVSLLKGDAREELDKKRQELLGLKDDLEEKLAYASHATSETWESTKGRVVEVTENLERKIESAFN